MTPIGDKFSGYRPAKEIIGPRTWVVGGRNWGGEWIALMGGVEVDFFLFAGCDEI